MSRTYRVLIGLGLGLLTAWNSAAQAQPNRYPNEVELKLLSQQLQRDVQKLQGQRPYTDQRSAQEKQVIRSFRANWAKVNPTIAPYLGKWRAIEETKSIFPSRQIGQVCIVDTYLRNSPTDSGTSLTIGKVVAGQIQVNDQTILLPQGEFLGSAFIVQATNRPKVYPYAYPLPLQNPGTEITQKLAQAGCTIGLP